MYLLPCDDVGRESQEIFSKVCEAWIVPSGALGDGCGGLRLGIVHIASPIVQHLIHTLASKTLYVHT